MNITPEQAINLVDQVCANFTGTRADHIKINAALECLRGLVASANAKSEAAPAPTPGEDSKVVELPAAKKAKKSE